MGKKSKRKGRKFSEFVAFVALIRFVELIELIVLNELIELNEVTGLMASPSGVLIVNTVDVLSACYFCGNQRALTEDRCFQVFRKFWCW